MLEVKMTVEQLEESYCALIDEFIGIKPLPSWFL